MFAILRGKSVNAMVLLALLLAAFVSAGVPAFAEPAHPGAVYVLSDESAGNRVLIFDRASDGTLSAAGDLATGQLGSGGTLGSQGSVALSENGRWLFAVNAGSNSISSFAIEEDGLSLVDTVNSGGVKPISLTSRKDFLYVLNAGSPNIAGFRVNSHGTLAAISGSSQPLSPNAVGPAQVQFSPDGQFLAVTEKQSGSGIIDIYPVGHDGRAGAPIVNQSNGAVPFGFAFDKRGHLIVSEAAPGALSSYAVRDDGMLETRTASLSDMQNAACWVAVSKDSRYVYTANAASGSVSGFSINHDGTLALLDANGITANIGAGSKPLDMDFSNNGRYLYLLEAGKHSIGAYHMQADGSLTWVSDVSGLPATTAGLAAR